MLVVETSEAGAESSITTKMSTTESSSSSRLHWDKEQVPHDRKHSVTGTNSSNDPSVQSSRGERTFSNSRYHPKAELLVKGDRSKNSLNHNHSSSDAKAVDRKRKNVVDDEDDIWTEHRSSSGRVYFYNKRLDKSQWEKPTKGIVKRLKPEPQTSSGSRSSSQSGSHTSKSRSHNSSSNSVKGHHHHESGNHRHSEHHSSKRKPEKPEKKTSNTSLQSKPNKSAAVTSPGSSRQTALPHTSTSNRLPSHFIGTPETLSSYMSMSSGPATPVHSYPVWSGIEASSVTPSSDGSGLHPLQRALILQNQYSQGYQFSPHHSTSLPTTPLQTHPPLRVLPSTTTPSTPVTPIPGTVPIIYPQNVVYHPEHVSLTLHSQKPMSKLGTWSLSNDGFPDPVLLKPLSQLPNNDFFNPALTQQWSSSLENCLKQMDAVQLETLSRTTVDLGYHCGQLAKNLLALECCRIKTVSRRTRITDLTKTIEMVEKTTP